VSSPLLEQDLADAAKGLSPIEKTLNADLDRLAEELSPPSKQDSRMMRRTSSGTQRLRAAAWAAACAKSLTKGKSPSSHAQRYIRSSTSESISTSPSMSGSVPGAAPDLMSGSAPDTIVEELPTQTRRGTWT